VALDAIDLELPGARVRFTGRAGGVSDGPYASLNLGRWTEDDPAAVAENRHRAADGAPIAFARQVHGTRVVALDAAPPEGDIADADGVVTRAHGVAAMVLTADCVPVALASPDAVAMVHAGWKGLSGGVLEAGVGGPPGPPPPPPEVAERFPAWALNGRLLDLKAVAAARLRAAGVTHVHDVDRCTMCEPDVFFSHRASGGLTGRQGGLAWRS
jgi:copper oxidase (laccase) domain-containing protein